MTIEVQLPTIGNLNNAIELIDTTLKTVSGRKTFSNIEVENLLLDLRLKIMKEKVGGLL